MKLKEITPDRKLSRKRLTLLITGIVALILCELARLYYRPYIYAHDINDFHIADTLGNTLGTVAGVFIILGILNPGGKKDYFLINTITISFVLFELAHPLLGKPIDPWDIIATVISGGFCFLLYRLLVGAYISRRLNRGGYSDR